MGGLGRVGFDVKVLSIGDIIRTTEEAPDGTGDIIQPTFTTLGLSYAKALTDRVNFGGSARLISEKVMQTGSTSVSFDFGFQYDTGVRGIRLGAAMQNFGAAQHFSGEDLDRNLLLPEDDPQSANRTLSRLQPADPALFSGSVSYGMQGGTRWRCTASTRATVSTSTSSASWRYGYRKQFALRPNHLARTTSSPRTGSGCDPLGSTNGPHYAGQSVGDYFTPSSTSG
jgi:hypothetical protein